MTIRAEKLETTILASLHSCSEGKRDGSIAEWENSMQAALGERPESADIVAVLIRLRNRGLVRLANSPQTGTSGTTTRTVSRSITDGSSTMRHS